MSNHEIPKLDRKGLRDFGLTLGGIIAILFGLIIPLLHGRPPAAWPWVIGVILLAWGLLSPLTLEPIYNIWMKFGIFLSKIITPIWMGLIFYLMFVPMGFLKGLFSKEDPMNRELDTSAETYRLASRLRPKESMERPF